eukprot:8450967-Pyramimonas_sp.AAC.1
MILSNPPARPPPGSRAAPGPGLSARAGRPCLRAPPPPSGGCAPPQGSRARSTASEPAQVRVCDAD